MLRNRVVRRVTKKTYDRYSTVDYSTSTDNLNPINPTSLETQFSNMVLTVKKRIVAAYNRNNVAVPEDLFSADVSPNALLNDVNNLINKLKNNPLQDLYNNFNSLDVLVPFVSSTDKADDIMDNPLKLDCSGIELTLNSVSKNSYLSNDENSSDNENTDDDEDEDENTDENENNSNSKIINITYVGLDASEDMSKYPSTLLESECPFTLSIPTVLPSGDYTFKSWYYDNYYNIPVPGNSLDWPGKDITLYALIDLVDEDQANTDTTTPLDLDTDNDSDPEDCELVELAFLKIILIVIIIIKILITTLVTVLNIMKATADIAKDAQLCWINPPSLQSLIAYVMQRLSAVIFQIIGMIFLKLWAMLNIDCISENTSNTIDQINQALAGMIDMLGTIKATALNFNNNDSDNSLWKTIQKSIKDLQEQIKEQATNVWDSMKDLGNQFKAAGSDIADTYSNPATYISAVPDEIRNKVLSSVDQYTETMNNVKQLQATITRLKDRKKKTNNNPTPKGMEILSF